ncbi:hypothetical protein HQ585_10205 [candidate division KSB1 bacterium]|nr:hypothetical protein [candidate division KSB1 bacterium]
MKKAIHIIVMISVLIGLAAMVHFSQQRMDQDREIHFVNRSIEFLPDGKTLRILSMGYRGLVADWLWIRAVLYFGRRVMDEDNPYYLYELYDGDSEKIRTLREHHEQFHDDGEAYEEDGHDAEHAQKKSDFRKILSQVDADIPQPPDSVFVLDQKLISSLYRFESRGLVDGVYPLIDRVVTIDPHFIKPYIFGGVYLMLETGRLKESLSLLEKGYIANPTHWEFPFYLGWLHWMYVGDLETTHHFLLEAVGRKDCPAYVFRLLHGLTQNLNRSEMTWLYLEGLFQSTDDPDSREQINQLLLEIRQNQTELLDP